MFPAVAACSLPSLRWIDMRSTMALSTSRRNLSGPPVCSSVLPVPWRSMTTLSSSSEQHPDNESWMVSSDPELATSVMVVSVMVERWQHVIGVMRRVARSKSNWHSASLLAFVAPDLRLPLHLRIPRSAAPRARVAVA